MIEKLHFCEICRHIVTFLAYRAENETVME